MLLVLAVVLGVHPPLDSSINIVRLQTQSQLLVAMIIMLLLIIVFQCSASGPDPNSISTDQAGAIGVIGGGHRGCMFLVI